MASHFYIIRHGETDWNKLQKIQGHTDIPLNDLGISQAQRLAKRLSSYTLHHICSSDLMRAKQTAEEIAKYHPEGSIAHFHEFRERNYGQWEGHDLKKIKELYPEHQDGQILGGKYGIERLEDMQQRVLQKLTDLAGSHPEKHIAIISHGGLINALLHAISQGEHGTGKTKLANTSYNHISYENGQWSIHVVNDSSHLDDE